MTLASGLDGYATVLPIGAPGKLQRVPWRDPLHFQPGVEGSMDNRWIHGDSMELSALGAAIQKSIRHPHRG
jgi:hypothetical protein